MADTSHARGDVRSSAICFSHRAAGLPTRMSVALPRSRGRRLPANLCGRGRDHDLLAARHVSVLCRPGG